MSNLIQINNNAQQQLFCTPICGMGLEPSVVARQKPDDQWMLMDQQDNSVLARCSLWWSQSPSYEGHTIGLIGHFAATGEPEADQILEHACQILQARGCTLVLGPMDGNTWQSYRLVTEQGEESSFFLEPQNPRAWPSYFEQNGFAPFAHYTSSLVTDFGTPTPAFQRIMQRLAARNISIRALDKENIEAELVRFYDLSVEAFRHNLLYTPIGKADFLAQYGRLVPCLDPEMILMAEVEGQLVGYLFMLPDLAQQLRGEIMDRAILKTGAVHPDYGHLGLSWALMEQAHLIAKERGYRQVVHALMHEDNGSRKLSQRYGGEIMRRYTLFGRSLS